MKRELLACAVAGVIGYTTSTAAAAGFSLAAVKTNRAITVDGERDEAWGAATPFTVTVDETPYKPSNGYAGISATEVELRALYDDSHLYLLVSWEDPTESLARFPWVKQADGSWRQQKSKDSTGHDNTFYEDKLAILWNINERGFAKKGCDRSCHIAENGQIEGIEDSSAGRHFTNAPGETLDAWHWKGVRSNPNSQMDDQFFNSDRMPKSKSWGRHSDVKSGGGYYDNRNDAGTAPAWMPAEPSATPRYWLLESEKTAFVDAFEPGAILPGVVTRPFQGPRADVSAKGVWREGRWTLEIRRRLVTEGEKSAVHDVQFNDLGKRYHFGVTVFDNSQINHLYHKKPIELTFQ